MAKRSYNGSFATKPDEPRGATCESIMSTTISSHGKSSSRPSCSTETKEVSDSLSACLSIIAAAELPDFWGPKSPKQIAKDSKNGWKRWLRYLATRKSPRPLSYLAHAGTKSLPRKQNEPPKRPFATPLAWGIGQFSHSTACMLEMVDALAVNRQRKHEGKSDNKKISALLAPQTLRDTLGQWLEMHRSLVEYNLGHPDPRASSPAEPIANDTWPENPWPEDWPTSQKALSCLALAHALPSLAEQIPAETWWQLLDALWRVVESSADQPADCELPMDQTLAGQLLASELPLTLAYLLPEIKPLSKLHETARDHLSASLLELLNGEGLPNGCHLPILRPLLACWTRCLLVGQTMKRRCWNRKAQNQYLWFARQAIRYSASDGRSLLAARSSLAESRPAPAAEDASSRIIASEKWSPDFLQTVIALGGDGSDLSAACGLFSKKMVALLDQPAKISPPETSDHCEWSGLAVMRTAWSRKAPVVAVDFSTPELKVEIITGRDTIAAGIWSFSTTLQGKQLEPVGPWEVACWFSDEDVDYLELSMDMTGGARLERKFVLARNDLFLLLTDSVTTDISGKSSRRSGKHGLVHTSSLPLAATCHWIPAEETREGLLVTGNSIKGNSKKDHSKKSISKKAQPLARVFPLALPEWRIDDRLGELTCTMNSGQQLLQWTCQTPGQRLASPLFIDLDPRRAAKPCTWRQLTVAQALEIQPAEVAAGYRVQCGKKQWLVYQSLAPRANRTLLGHNLASEYLVGRFLAASGEVDELLEIEEA